MLFLEIRVETSSPARISTLLTPRHTPTLLLPHAKAPRRKVLLGHRAHSLEFRVQRSADASDFSE